jgi:hypothetical protein
MLDTMADLMAAAVEGALDTLLHSLDASLGVREGALRVLARAGAALWRA